MTIQVETNSSELAGHLSQMAVQQNKRSQLVQQSACPFCQLLYLPVVLMTQVGKADVFMQVIVNFPRLMFIASLAVLWTATRLGMFARNRLHPLSDDEKEHSDVVLAATLTLLGLIIGFSFSMAMSRYDQRKNYEEEEANAIGTEYLRVELLPAADAVRVQDQLRQYLDQRVLYYTERDAQRLGQIDADTEQQQKQMWAVVRAYAEAHPTPIAALAASGMNDVLNSQGYTHAAWLNRIPVPAWTLMAIIALFCNYLIGYTARGTRLLLVLVFPLIISTAFFLIADMDSPRRGVIRVVPQNLLVLSQSLHASQ